MLQHVPLARLTPFRTFHFPISSNEIAGVETEEFILLIVGISKFKLHATTGESSIDSMHATVDRHHYSAGNLSGEALFVRTPTRRQLIVFFALLDHRRHRHRILGADHTDRGLKTRTRTAFDCQPLDEIIVSKKGDRERQYPASSGATGN